MKQGICIDQAIVVHRHGFVCPAFEQGMIKQHGKGSIALLNEREFSIHQPVFARDDAIGKACLQRVACRARFVGIAECNGGILVIQVQRGVACQGTMGKSIAAATACIKVVTVVADEAIDCCERTVMGHDASNCTVADGTIVQGDIAAFVCRNAFQRIENRGVIQYVAGAVRAKINALPGAGLVFVRRVEAVVPKGNASCAVFAAVDVQGAVNGKGCIGVAKYLHAFADGECSPFCHGECIEQYIGQIIRPGGILDKNYAAQKMCVPAKCIQFYILNVAVVIDAETVFYQERLLLAAGIEMYRDEYIEAVTPFHFNVAELRTRRSANVDVEGRSFAAHQLQVGYPQFLVVDVEQFQLLWSPNPQW